MGKRSFLFTVLLVVSVIALAAGPPQEKKQMTQEEMMDQMMKYSMPTKEHAFLKNFAGNWDAEVKGFQPGAPPQTSTATIKAEMIFDGRFLKSDFTGSMMAQPFMGFELMGFDLYQKKYVTLWIDSMSTNFFLTVGPLDPTGKILTQTGTWPDAMTGGTMKVRQLYTLLGDGKYRFEMFMTRADGKEEKMLEYTATRKM